jgi:hypothetical protein
MHSYTPVKKNRSLFTPVFSIQARQSVALAHKLAAVDHQVGALHKASVFGG